MTTTKQKPACRARIVWHDPELMCGPGKPAHVVSERKCFDTDEQLFIAPVSGNGLPELRAFCATLSEEAEDAFPWALRQYLGIRAPKKGRAK